MRIPAKIADTFSPYLDAYAVVDFVDDLEKRTFIAVLATIALNSAFFAALTMSSHYIVIPPLIPDIIPIRIVASVGETEEPPEPVQEALPTPAIPTPSPTPAPRPRPQPAAPQPATIEPTPAPEIEIEPIIQPVMPTPEIISRPEPEPDETALPKPPEIIETIEPEITMEPPEPEIVLDDAPALITPPDITAVDIAEPILAPEPIIEPPLDQLEPDIATEIIEPPVTPGPIFENAPLVPPEDIIETPESPELPVLEATPGIIEPLSGIVVPTEPDAAVTPQTPVEAQDNPVTPDAPAKDAPIITNAPMVLADDDAAQSERERDRAVPQSQADTGPSGGYRTPTIGGGGISPLDPNAGGGGRSTGPVAGTGRAAPGAGGWSLGEGAQGDYDGEGGMRGVLYDTRCRDKTRMHEDCPEYVAKPKGRDVDGYETPRINRGSVGRGTRGLGSIGRDTSTSGGNFPATSNGMPSTTVLDDTDFGVLYGRTPQVDIENAQPRLRDLFDEDQDFVNDTQPLPDLGEAPPIVDENEDPWALDKLPE